MPRLPQQPILASPDGTTGPELRAWGDGLVASIRRLWTMLTYTVNALCRVDTLANRTSTPTINEIFFVASDTLQLFVGVAGAWQNAGPRRARTTIAESATSAAVTFSPAENAATYSLTFAPSYNAGAVWYTAKATSGFTINVSTAAPVGGGTVDWTLWRA